MIRDVWEKLKNISYSEGGEWVLDYCNGYFSDSDPCFCYKNNDDDFLVLNVDDFNKFKSSVVSSNECEVYNKFSAGDTFRYVPRGFEFIYLEEPASKSCEICGLRCIVAKKDFDYFIGEPTMIAKSDMVIRKADFLEFDHRRCYHLDCLEFEQLLECYKKNSDVLLKNNL